MKTIKRAELEQEISHYKDLSQKIKALQAEQDELKKALVKSYFEKHPAYTDKEGHVLATYSTTIRHMFNSTEFKKEQPALYGKYSYDQEIHTLLIK